MPAEKKADAVEELKKRIITSKARADKLKKDESAKPALRRLATKRVKRAQRALKKQVDAAARRASKKKPAEA